MQSKAPGTTPLHVDKLITEIRNVATANPGKKAECTYVKNGQPNCIVGVAFYNLGFSVQTIENFGSSAGEVAKDMALEGVTKEKYNWLDLVQWNQDNEADWYTALALADRNKQLTADGSVIDNELC